MKEPCNFHFLGRLPEFDGVLAAAAALTANDWVSYTERKHMGGVAGGHTDTIPLLYGTRDVLSAQREHQMFQVFANAIHSIADIYSQQITNAAPARAVLARMAPRSEIKRHRDRGAVSATTHRIHLPIITNSGCLFTVEDETEHMAAGELWLIDNVDKYHSVANNGSEFRVHLIVDVIDV